MPARCFSFSTIISDKKNLTLLTEGSGIFRCVSACYKTPKISISAELSDKFGESHRKKAFSVFRQWNLNSRTRKKLVMTASRA